MLKIRRQTVDSLSDKLLLLKISLFSVLKHLLHPLPLKNGLLSYHYKRILYDFVFRSFSHPILHYSGVCWYPTLSARDIIRTVHISRGTGSMEINTHDERWEIFTYTLAIWGVLTEYHCLTVCFVPSSNYNLF